MEKKIICLFDVDQTLTPARMDIQQSMVETLDAIMAKGIHVGIVSGSDEKKVREQVHDDLINKAEYTFAENGLYAMKNAKEFSTQSFKDHLGEKNLQRLINFSLKYIADLDIPVKR
jgi:phosphomannomutase